MKIVFTGGGTGGHFYPLMAIAQEINNLAEAGRLVDVSMYYLASSPYDEHSLFEAGVKFSKVPSGKWRRHASLRNFFDIFSTIRGIIVALIRLFNLFPDIVVGKGGFDSFPVLFAARLFRIPVLIHESDSLPGRVNLWAAKFAKRIAVSYAESGSFFSYGKNSVDGASHKKRNSSTSKEGAHEFLKLKSDIPTILVLGGSQGAMVINDVILSALPKLMERYQIIHQTGTVNFEEITGRAAVVVNKELLAERYRPFGFLNDTALSMAAGISELVISRAGSTLFEIANWGIPSIVIPIRQTVSHDQRKNALSYVGAGAGVLLEEENLSSHIFVSEIDRIIGHPNIKEEMRAAVSVFRKPDAARVIAEEILAIGYKHDV